MTVSATSISLPLKARIPRHPVETASLQSCTTATADADARRFTAAVAAGDEAVFCEFYEAYRQRLFRFALVLAHGDETLAHDTVQAAFITAAKKLRHVENAEHLWNWLARVARQQLGKAWRNQRQNSAIVGMAEPPDLPHAAAESVLEENLDTALLAMDDAERELLEWFYFDRLSHKEIAGRLAATPKSVSSRLERARAKLRLAMTRKLSHET